VGVTGIVTQWIRAERTIVANSAFLEMADGAAQRLLIQVAEDPELQQHNLEKVRQRLLTSAQSFYRDLAKIDRLANVDKDSPYVLLQRARAYTKLAMITSEIESTWSAREQQKTGIEIIRQTLRHDPDNLDGVAALADGLLYLGFYDYQMGRFLDAHSKWEEALENINKVVAVHPANYDHVRTKARAHSLLAVFYRVTGNLREAESQQAKVLACMPDLREYGRHLPRGEQETLLDEAGCHMNLADLYFRKWDLRRARSECEEVLRITKDQGALTFEGLGIIARAYLAWSDYNAGKLTVAETGLRQAIAHWRQLGQRHPGVI
jgi:tetratricopeptide (TPR) repeat protein